MSRFNTKAAKQPAPSKGRVCLFIDTDLYIILKSALTLEQTNPSQFFEKVARQHLTKKWPHMLARGVGPGGLPRPEPRTRRQS